MCVSLQQADLNRQSEEALEEIKEMVTKAKWLTAKEKRAYLYIIDGGSRIIGDMCNTLKTTPRTLFKTMNGLRAKGLIDG